MRAWFAILESLVSLMPYLKKLLERKRLSSNYRRLSLYVLMARIHSTLPMEPALKRAWNRTHWNPIFKSAIPDQNRKKRMEGTVQ